MATVNHTSPGVKATPEVRVIQWVLTTANSDGDWVEIPDYADKTIHIYGTFGAGTLTLQGTNETGTPANPETLNDTLGTAIALTAAGMRAVLENPLKVRPNLTGSTGATVTVVIVARRK